MKNAPSEADHDPDDAVCEAVLAEIRRRPGGPGRRLLSSFRLETVDRARDLAPDIATAWLAYAVGDGTPELLAERGHTPTSCWRPSVGDGAPSAARPSLRRIMTRRPSTRPIVVAVLAVVVLGAGCDSDDDQLSEGDDTTVPPAASAPAPSEPAVTASSPAPSAASTPASTAAGAVPSSSVGEPVGSETSVFEQGDIDPGLQPFIDMAIDDLAGRLGVGPEVITAVSGVLVVWPDASLGCPQPGMQYAQVPVDGSLIELATGGRVYRYHTGGSRGPFLCNQPLKEIPQTGDAPAD